LNHFDFFKHDLNLLVAFDALYVEKSVSGAAKKMGVSQSAMSQSLRRLRAAFDDELFIRAPRGMEPTQGAQALSDPLREILLQVHKLLIAKSAFVPTEVERVFTLTMWKVIESGDSWTMASSTSRSVIS
jgi:LysR family transcriptional activator of mexEF-oprN operon